MSGVLPLSNIQCEAVGYARLAANGAWQSVAFAGAGADALFALQGGGAPTLANRRTIAAMTIKNHGAQPLYVQFGGAAPAAPPTAAHPRVDAGEHVALPAYGSGWRVVGEDVCVYVYATDGEASVWVEVGEW